MAAYICNIAQGQQIYLNNQASLTAIALVSSSSTQQQSQRQSFETGKWLVPPTVFQTSKGIVLRIEAEHNQYFIQVQANGISRLSNMPSLDDAEVLPLGKIDEAAIGQLMPMQPMEPMKPMPPMQL